MDKVASQNERIGINMNARVKNALTAGCHCGSGLSRGNCCDLNLSTVGARRSSIHVVRHERQAIQPFLGGGAESTERVALTILETSPTRIDALSALYKTRKADGNQPAVESLIQRILTLDPENFWAINEITLLYLGKHALMEAERYARQAVRIAPTNAQSHFLLGMVLTEGNSPEVGEVHYYRALELSGARDPTLLANLALCLYTQGKMEAARELYRESLNAEPKCLQALLGFARLEEADRNLEAASELLDRAEALSPADPGISLTRAAILSRLRQPDAALSVFEGLEAQRGRLYASESLEKGRLLDKLGRYDEAFACFSAGKQRLLEVTGHIYLASQALQTSSRLKKFFSAENMNLLPRARVRNDVAQPIFILGFPRSGTTLLEQTLSIHSRVAAGNELPVINEIIQVLPRILNSPLSYPEALADLAMADHSTDLDILRDIYLHKVKRFGIALERGGWFTDKMTLNETNLGLISLLFPRSPLLHVVRHPLDVILSVFSHPLKIGYNCAESLETIARHYVLVMDLVEHYLRQLTPRYLRVHYEDMVLNQTASMRSIFKFADEEFEPRCLAFHENPRFARTFSYAQVTEPLYERSLYRYKNYMQQLTPVIPILQETINQLGYSI